MKSNTTPFLRFSAVLAIGAALVLSACSRSDNTATETAATDTTATSPTSSMVANTMTDNWENLQAYSYEQRSEFEARARAMADRLDDRAENASGEAKDAIADARDELRSAAAEISNATADTWEATKERVGRAWQKAESAIEGAAE